MSMLFMTTQSASNSIAPLCFYVVTRAWNHPCLSLEATLCPVDVASGLLERDQEDEGGSKASLNDDAIYPT